MLTKNDFKSNYFTEGSNFKENNTVQSSRGGSTLFRVDPTFSWRGRVRLLIPMETCALMVRKCNKQLRVYVS